MTPDQSPRARICKRWAQSANACRVRTLLCVLLGAALAALSPFTSEALAATDVDGSSAARAADASSAAASDSWVYPLIHGYGAVHPRPDLPSRLSAGTDYKVIVDVIHGDSNHAQVLGSLVRLARLVNLMAYAGIPADHVHIAVVIEDMAGYGVLTDDAYRKLFKQDNPNLALLHELRKAGVELMVCAQALAENNWQDNDVTPDVTVTLSALTDFVVYGQRGYSFMQL